MALINVLFLAALLLICAGIYWFARGVAELLDGWRVARLSERRGVRPQQAWPQPTRLAKQELPGGLRASRRRARRARMRGGHEG